jgi:hypothetical protein
MTAKTLPATPTPRRVQVRWGGNSLASISPLSGAVQISARLGGAWILSIDYPPMTRFQSGAWQAALFDVDGTAQAILTGPDHPRPLDHYNPGPVSVLSDDGASLILLFTAAEFAARYFASPPAILTNGTTSALSSTIAVDGMNGIGLNRGDWISFPNAAYPELHIVTADAFPNSSGEATVSIHPPTRRAIADNQPVTIESPKGEFVYQSADGAAFELDERGVQTPITLQLQEFVR